MKTPFCLMLQCWSDAVVSVVTRQELAGQAELSRWWGGRGVAGLDRGSLVVRGHLSLSGH